MTSTSNEHPRMSHMQNRDTEKATDDADIHYEADTASVKMQAAKLSQQHGSTSRNASTAPKAARPTNGVGGSGASRNHQGRPRPQARPSATRPARRTVSTTDTPSNPNGTARKRQTAPRRQAPPAKQAVRSRAQVVKPTPKRPASETTSNVPPRQANIAKLAPDSTNVLVRHPMSTTGVALVKRPAVQSQAQMRKSRRFSTAKHAKHAKSTSLARTQAAKLRVNKSVDMTTILTRPKVEQPASSAAVELAKKFSSLPFPHVVLPAKDPKVISAEHADGNFDTRSPLTKARDFLDDWIHSPHMVIVGAFAVIYLLGSLLWSFIYLPGTTIDGLDASWATPSGLAARIEGEIAAYDATVSGNGVDLSISSSDVDLSFDSDTWKESAHVFLPSFGWPIQLITKRNFSVSEGVSFSESKLERMVTAAVESANKTAQDPKNATFEFDKAKDRYVAVKEQAGTSVNLAHAFDTIKQGVASLQASIPLSVQDLNQPSLTITSSDFASVLEQANQLAHMNIVLTYNDEKMYTIDDELVRSWLTINKSNTVTADIDKVTEWTRGPFSQQVDTIGTSRTYTRAGDGKTITVAGGTYGWSVDGKKLANLIRTHITAHSEDPVEVPMYSAAKKLVLNGQDWGSRYIDVDLSEQYVRMFDENSDVIVEAPCVTGNLSQGQSTVEGVYYIEYKESPAVLVGLDYDGDGVADYETPVNFWMPFYGGYGLHDAYWRDYFGADAFTYDGSHGCVNLPYYAAEAIYSVAEAGDVVVVHW